MSFFHLQRLPVNTLKEQHLFQTTAGYMHHVTRSTAGDWFLLQVWKRMLALRSPHSKIQVAGTQRKKRMLSLCRRCLTLAWLEKPKCKCRNLFPAQWELKCSAQHDLCVFVHMDPNSCAGYVLESVCCVRRELKIQKEVSTQERQNSY